MKTAFGAPITGMKQPNVDTGSSLGPFFDAGALGMTFVQNQLDYVYAISRMSTISALPNNAPNPDLDSFCEPFGVYRLSATASTGTVTCSTPSPVSSKVIVPAYAIIVSPSGVTFQIQPNGPNYSMVDGGYPITVGNSSVDVPVTCLVLGIIGNMVVNTSFTSSPIGGLQIPSVTSIVNAAAFTDAEAAESDVAYKARFTITVSSGRAGTGNACIAAALGVQAGIIYSYGDRIDEDGYPHDAYFTMVINLAGTGTAPPDALLDSVTDALEGLNGYPQVRPAGCSYAVVAPNLIEVDGVFTVIPTAQFASQATAVRQAAKAQFQAFCNSIGLNVDTTPTTCSLAKCYAALLQTQINGVYCLADVTDLTLNGTAADLTANFLSQFVFGSSTVTVGP